MRTETINCQDCGKSFVWQTELEPGEPFYSCFRPKRCETCASAEDERIRLVNLEKEQAQLAARVASFMDGVQCMIPPLFQKTDVTNPRFNAAAWQKIQAWRSTDEKPWLGMIGPTGTSKSRMAYLLARDIARDIAERHFTEIGTDTYHKPRVIFATSYEIGDAALAQYSNKQHEIRPIFGGDRSPAQKARDFLDRLHTADLLLIDDVGKGRLTPAVCAEFFAVIDHRHVNLLPTIWTANSTPGEIASSMSSDIGPPFAGRLHDSSRIVKLST